MPSPRKTLTNTCHFYRLRTFCHAHWSHSTFALGYFCPKPQKGKLSHFGTFVSFRLALPRITILLHRRRQYTPIASACDLCALVPRPKTRSCATWPMLRPKTKICPIPDYFLRTVGIE